MAAKTKAWPPYRGDLKTVLQPHDNLVDEIPKRLSAACKLYGIDQSDPLWERRLLMTMLHRHVPGFQYRATVPERIDNAFVIETIDALKDFHEEREGVRPSTDAVVQEIMDSPRAGNPAFVQMGDSRLMRIYAGRNEFEKDEFERSNQLAGNLDSVRKANRDLEEASADSHARLFLEQYRKRFR